MSGPGYADDVPALIKYTVLRLALFVAAMGVLYLLGARGILNLALAAVVSMLLSYLLLRGPREALAQEVAGRVGRRLDGPADGSRGMLGLDDDSAAEDAAVDNAAGDAPAEVERSAVEDHVPGENPAP